MSPFSSLWIRRFSLAMGLLLLGAGCGSDRPATYPVRGRVVFSNGQPVKLGTVELLSKDHRINATGTIQADGSFELGTFSSRDGACAGEHSVIVMQMIVTEGLQKHQNDHGLPVDLVFSSYTTSPLKASIQPEGDNSLVLTVEPAKKR